jgi:hypothetical protein
MFLLLLSHLQAIQKNRSSVSRFIVQSGVPNAYSIGILSFSYRASSIRVTISITHRCDFCFMSLFHISLLTLHASGLHRPIIRGISSSFLYTTVWFMQCLLIVCVRLRTGLWRWLYCTQYSTVILIVTSALLLL